jgi:putative selenium metabolism protein SsnA
MLILNGTLIQDLSQVLPGHGLRIEGEKISATGPDADLRAQYPGDDILDAQGGLIMPAKICAHTHFYGAYARGMSIPGPAPADFPAILRRLWWNLDKALDADTIRASALVCLVEAIKHGTTTLIDHHASPSFIGGSLEIIAEAVEAAGLRAALCYEVSDRDGATSAAAGIAENVRFAGQVQGHPRLAATFGLHASLSLSDDTLRACVRAAEGAGLGFHIHVAEHEADEYDSLYRYGKRVVQRLRDLGILGPRSLVAHTVHCDQSELQLLGETQTWVTHQPRSNMNNAVGAAPLDSMIDAGLRLCLGNDGFSNEMWAEWKAAYFLHKAAHRDPRRAGGDKIARMAMENNAALAEMFFPGQRIGRLEAGALADVILVDYYPYTPLSAGNLPWHILFGFEASMLRTTISSGRVLMHNRVLQTLDERQIMQEALALAPALWERYQKLAGPATID